MAGGSLQFRDYQVLLFDCYRIRDAQRCLCPPGDALAQDGSIQRVLSPLRHGVTADGAFKEASCVSGILFLGAYGPHSWGTTPHADWMSERFDRIGLIGDLWH